MIKQFCFVSATQEQVAGSLGDVMENGKVDVYKQMRIMVWAGSCIALALGPIRNECQRYAKNCQEKLIHLN